MASTNNKTCQEHHWPLRGPNMDIRSIGTVEYEQCNCCLAIRVTFSTIFYENNDWRTLTDTKVIEPSF